jgi:hypothetical protein
MKNENLALVIFLVFIFGAGVYFYFSQMVTQNVTQTSPLIESVPLKEATTASSIKPLNVPLDSLNESTGLRTYRNEEFGFEFSYPKDAMTRGEEETSSSVNPSQLLRFTFGGGTLSQGEVVVEKTSVKNIEEYTFGGEIIENLNIKEQRYVIISGEKARVTTFVPVKQEDEGLGGLLRGSEKDVYVEILHDKKVFSLFLLDRRTEDFPGTVIATFKFIK